MTAVLLVAVACAAAAFVLEPLARTESGLAREPDRERYERARDLAYRALRDLEMDRATGKLGEADYAALRARHETDAVAALRGLDALRPVDVEGARGPEPGASA